MLVIWTNESLEHPYFVDSDILTDTEMKSKIKIVYISTFAGDYLRKKRHYAVICPKFKLNIGMA